SRSNKNRSGVRKLRKHNEAHGQEGSRARHCRIDHREHAVCIRAHGATLHRVWKVRLARGDRVSYMFHFVWYPKIIETYYINYPGPTVIHDEAVAQFALSHSHCGFSPVWKGRGES